MVKLNQEEREEVKDFIGGHGWPALLIEIENLVTQVEKNVLTYNLKEGLQGLGDVKARAEGARQLLTAIKNMKASYKVK